MKPKTKETKESGNRYSIMLGLRLTEDERRRIEQVADKAGCTLSQAARMLLFDNGKWTEITNASHEKKCHLALKGTREEFRRLVEMYRMVAEKLDFEKAVSDPNNARFLRALEKITVDLQKTLNAALAILNEKEVHLVSRNLEEIAAKNEAKTSDLDTEKYKDFIINYCYMEKIMIVGFLLGDAEEYEKGNEKKMRFGVGVERKKKGGKTRVVYTVFSKRDNAIEFLKKGRQVTVVGNFGENEKGEKMVFADSIILGMSSDE